MPLSKFAAVAALGLCLPGAWRHDRERAAFRSIAQRAEFAGVARLVVDGATASGGGGTLVGDRWVLTAAHVVDRWIPGADWRWEWGGVAARFDTVVLHPAYRGARSLDERVDLALVRLASPVQAVPPAVIHRRGAELGKRIALVGFGTAQPANSLGGYGDQTTPGEKYAGFNVVDSVSAGHLHFDMDGPGLPHLNVLGSAQPDSLEYFPLGGDSGGGVFAQDGGRWELVGVHGTVAIDMARVMEHGWYGQAGRLNRVSAHVAWIDTTMRTSSAGGVNR